MTIDATTLDNGLRVVSERLPGARSTAIGAWFAVGSRDETPEQSGVSHFLEHLLFKGTATRSAREVAETIDGVGGDMNAFTAREYTAFYARVPAFARDVVTETLFDVLRRPALRPTDVDAERMVIQEELIAALDTPDDIVHMVLYDSLFEEHPLGREVLGDPATIDAMTAEDIAGFHASWYQPANLVLAAAGDVDHEEFVVAAEANFGDLEPSTSPVRHGAPACAPAVVGSPLPVEQIHVALGWQGVSHVDPRRFALSLANQILGGSPSSRLFQAIREELGLAYTVFSQTSGYSDVGSATVYAATASARGGELLNALSNEMERFVADGVTARELDLARSGVEGAVVLGLEDSGSRMSRLATGYALRGSVASIDELLDQFRAVTLDDVNAVIADVYGGDRVTSLVGPEAALSSIG